MLAYLFIVIAVAVRFMPHPMMFTPVAAALLFFGARGLRRMWWLPVVLLAASDVVLTTMVYHYSVRWDQFVTWAWYAAVVWLGSNLKQNAGVVRIAGAALAASVSFFVISNFTVWAAWGSMYPRSFAGLMACYDAGLPFFQRAIEGDIFFTAAMFATPVALHALAQRMHRTSDDHVAAA